MSSVGSGRTLGVPDRPPQVAWACRLATFCSVFVLLVIASALSSWGSPALRADLQDAIDQSPFGSGLDVGQLQQTLRYALMSVAAGCAAAVLAAAWTVRGHGGARVLLTVLAVAAPLSAPLLGISGVVVAVAGVACAVLLWSRPARDWFRLASDSSDTASSHPVPSRRSASMSHPTPPAGADRPDGYVPPPPAAAPQGSPPQWPSTGSAQPYGSTGSPPQPGQQPPYGQPAYAPSYTDAYGQPYAPPYGQPYAYGAPGFGVDPTRRPGAVTAAAVITMLFAGLTLLLSLLGGLGVLARRDSVESDLLTDPRYADTFTAANIGTLVTAIGLLCFFFAMLAAVSIVLAVLVLRGRGWARVALIVLSVLTALAGLALFLAVIPLLWTAGAAAVVVLLSVSSTRQWFALRGYEGRPGVPS